MFNPAGSHSAGRGRTHSFVPAPHLLLSPISCASYLDLVISQTKRCQIRMKSRVCTQYFCLSPRLRGPCATYDHVRLSPDQLGDAPGQGGAWAQGYSWVVPGAGFQPVDQGLLSGGGTRGACFTLIFISRSEERRVGKECRSRWSPDH